MSKLDPTAIGVGITFFIVFWLATDNLALGVSMGTCLGVAIAVNRQEEKQQDAESGDSETKT